MEQEQKDNDTTDYVYRTEWLEVDIPSSGFHYPQNHQNPQRSVPIESTMIERPRPCLGAYELSEADWWSAAFVHPSSPLAPPLAARGAAVVEGSIYVQSGAPPHMGAVPGEPAIGDMRITYRTVELPASEATAVGVQAGSTLRPYTQADAAKILGGAAADEGEVDIGEADARAVQSLFSSTGERRASCCQIWIAVSGMFAKLMLMVMRSVVGTNVGLLSPLQKSVGGMFMTENLRVERALSAFRILGTILFILAFYLVLHPFAALFSFIPFLGRLISSLFLLAAIIVGFMCAVSTILASWLVVKPARSCLGFICMAGLYYLEVYFEYASLQPLYLLSALALVAGVLALKEAYDAAQFRKAAMAKLAGYTSGARSSYVQVGMPVNKEMV